MCGRYHVNATWAQLVALWRPVGADDEPPPWPRFNAAPTQLLPIVVQAPDGIELRAWRWGFPRLWVREQGGNPWSGPMINARAEEAHRSGLWKAALQHRRCLVPATGFYEWAPPAGGAPAGGPPAGGPKARKRPVSFAPGDGSVITFAGVYGTFRDPAGHPVTCFSILTSAADPLVGRFHDRAPVVVGAADAALWLDPAVTEAGALQELLQARRLSPWQACAANGGVNDVRNEGPWLLEPDWALE